LTKPERVAMSGLRASAVVFVGVGVVNLSNYVFHLLSARQLGPSSYGDVATLAAVSGIIGLPLGGAQVFAARHVAAVESRGRPLNDDEYLTGFAGAMLAAGGVLTLVLLAGSPLIRSALSIRSLSAVIFTVLLTAPAFLAPVLLGAIQGVQRFWLVAAAIAVPSLVRVALAAAALAAGLGVAGVMAATFVAALVSLAIPLTVLRRGLGSVRAWRPRLPRRELLALLPVLGGLLAITCLSTDDLVAAKAVFPSHEAGLYGGASLIGRVILYLPAAIVTVLLPKVSAGVSAARGTGGIFARSVFATAAFCVTATLIYAIAPHLIVRIAFGSSYEGAASLLWMFGVAMTLYAVLNVLLFYRLGHGETQTCWLLLAGGIVQALVYAGLHSSPRELLTVSIATGGILLLASVAGPSSRSPLSLRELRHRDVV
jgi:O-antigen/teichoic acid export membrane protein